MAENELFITHEHIDRGELLGRLVSFRQVENWLALRNGKVYRPMVVFGDYDSVEATSEAIVGKAMPYKIFISILNADKFLPWYESVVSSTLARKHVDWVVGLVEEFTPEQVHKIVERYPLEGRELKNV